MPKQRFIIEPKQGKTIDEQSADWIGGIIMLLIYASLSLASYFWLDWDFDAISFTAGVLAAAAIDGFRKGIKRRK